MFAHETARETVVFTPYKYTYVCTSTPYYLRPWKTFKVIQGG